MKFLALLIFSFAGVQANPIVVGKNAVFPQGIDVSSFQPNVDWTGAKQNGISFANASLPAGYQNPSYSSQYAGAASAGIIRGAYHFAWPDSSSGVAQATYFLAHGGGWTNDGLTLPGALDIEYAPSGPECYGLNSSAMVSWITDFSNTYHAATNRYPVIYTTTDWWTSCTGNSDTFGSTNPLWIARFASTIGTIPAGWLNATFWQYADVGPNPGDQDIFNGNEKGLKCLAVGV
ncbi:glycoside hydrolase family 25 protein [Crucibulum laeve]|uniref:N,O-diacetylmuramidase n=1 Tax=Crucibulum laeve TaxID=68775 RepID=A0A5C3M0X1_9AGAR|nr:glycoside hydrolase family 25 protein [Crucibulum laeve]